MTCLGVSWKPAPAGFIITFFFSYRKRVFGNEWPTQTASTKGPDSNPNSHTQKTKAVIPPQTLRPSLLSSHATTTIQTLDVTHTRQPASQPGHADIQWIVKHIKLSHFPLSPDYILPLYCFLRNISHQVAPRSYLWVSKALSGLIYDMVCHLTVNRLADKAYYDSHLLDRKYSTRRDFYPDGRTGMRGVAGGRQGGAAWLAGKMSCHHTHPRVDLCCTTMRSYKPTSEIPVW